jgi:glycosyltransferase involved in cell wall biosynthesis
MRILSVHNAYQLRGGEDESRQLEEELLRRNGHHVEIYEEQNTKVSEIGDIKLAARVVWSRVAYRTVERQLSLYPHDLMHVQNFFPLISPSVYYAARAQKVPVVQTLRNFRLLCLNGFLFREGKVCESCVKQPFPWPGVVNRCYRDSLPASLGVFNMLTVHRLLGTWNHLVDQYIALTHYDRRKFIEGGLPGDRISVKPNFVYPDPGVAEGRGGYILFVGRLSAEKGLDTFLEAAQQLGNKVSFKIVGEGPLAEVVQTKIAKSNNIEWLGRKPLPEVYDIMGNALALVFPSKWTETFSRVVVESFAKGTPVIASGVTDMEEFVAPYQTGLLFQPGNAGDLATQIEWILSHPTEVAQMRQEARKIYEEYYTAEKNYEKVMEIYDRALQQAHR